MGLSYTQVLGIWAAGGHFIEWLDVTLNELEYSVAHQLGGLWHMWPKLRKLNVQHSGSSSLGMARVSKALALQ